MQPIRRSGVGKWLAFAVGATLFSAPAFAQSRNASIAGTITDNTGAGLPGVTVTITSPALQVPALVKVSEADGTYQFVDLPVGTYRLTYEMAGFSRLAREDIRLTTGFAARVDALLNVAIAETVTVSGQSPLVDVTNTRGGTTVTAEVIASTPTNLNHQDILALAGGTFIVAAPQFNAVGLTNLQFNIQNRSYGQLVRMGNWVEGIKNSHSEVPDFASTEEVDVKTFGNSAENDLPGANIQIVYKAGGNQFHGRATGYYQDDRFQSDNIDDRLRSQGLGVSTGMKFLHQASGEIGGPILRDKLWFFVARLWAETERGSTGFAQDPGPDGVYLTVDDTPGYPRNRQANNTLKVSYQATRNHKFIGFAAGAPSDDPDYLSSRFRPHETTRSATYTTQQSKFEWQGLFTDRLLANSMIARSGYDIHYKLHPDIAPAACRQYQDTGLRTGRGCGGFGATNGPDLIRRPIRTQFSGSVTYYPSRNVLGSHNLTAGYFVNPGRLYVAITSPDPTGEYMLVFDRVAGGPYQPSEFHASDVPVDGGARQNVSAAYLTDTWNPTRRVTLNVGLRWERTDIYIEPQIKSQGTFGFGGAYPRLDVGTWSGFAPRVGVAVDLFGDGRTVAKATYGLYNHSEFENYVNPMTFATLFNKNSVSDYSYRWRDQDGNNDYTPGEVNLDINGPDFLSVAGPANNLVNPDLEWGRTHEVTASLERELVPNVSVRGLYVYKRAEGETEARGLVNILRPYEVWNRAFARRDPGPDGALDTADDAGVATVYDYDPAYRGAQFVANIVPNVPSDRDDSYQNLEVSLQRRPGSAKWFANTSLLVTKNHRWLTAIVSTPNEEQFRLDQTWSIVYRLAGGYDLPYGFTVSTLYQVFSGFPGQRTVTFRAADPDRGPAFPSSSTITLPVEEFGAQSLPVRHQMNLRLFRRFGLGGSRRLMLSVDAFNALNTNVAYGATFLSGPTFGYVTTISPPRVFRLGATFDF